MSKPKIGKLPNMRAGFYHIHSGSYECGMAYWLEDGERWQKCSRLVNHDGNCGHEIHYAF